MDDATQRRVELMSVTAPQSGVPWLYMFIWVTERQRVWEDLLGELAMPRCGGSDYSSLLQIEVGRRTS